MLEYWKGGMLGKDFSNMLACRRPRLHTYGRGRPYADIETPHYSKIPSFHYSSSSYQSVCSRPAAAGPGGALVCDINWGHRHPACALAEQARCLFSQCLMFAYNFIGMLGKDCSTCWRAGVLACTRTGKDARTPILKHPIIPTFPSKVTPQFVAALSLTLIALASKP